VSEAMHMVQLQLAMRALFARARTVGMRGGDPDLGYLVHCRLQELFGEHAPAPFSIDEPLPNRRDDSLRVLAYSGLDAEALERVSGERQAGEPLDFSRLLSKRMPAPAVGAELAFETRVCPVLRKSSAGAHHRKGAEVDVFIDECWRHEKSEAVSREAVYERWLRQRLHEGGAELLAGSLERFELRDLFRRTQASSERRKGRRPWKPDAVLSGRLRVSDADAFATLLRRGVGRHRAFGFGMLLLRKPG